MRFDIVIKFGTGEVSTLRGQVDLHASHVSVEDAHKIIETEQFLERLTGYRFHINSEE
jgi:hypothetical protein